MPESFRKNDFTLIPFITENEEISCGGFMEEVLKSLNNWFFPKLSIGKYCYNMLAVTASNNPVKNQDYQN